MTETVVSSACRTNAKIHVSRTSWTIENFTFCDADELESIKFRTNEGKEFSWHYVLFPRKYNGICYIIALDMHIDSCEGSSKSFIKTEVVNSKNEKRLYSKQITTRQDNCSNIFNASRDDFFESSELTFHVEFSRVDEFKCQEDLQFVKPKSKFKLNFKDLLENETFSDVTIVVEDRKFQAHRAILAARSPIFAAMFSHEMAESKLNIVTITDVEPEVFDVMLRFIYTDSVENLKDMALKLLQVADKYDLEKLKILCEESLGRNLSEETALETLAYADLYRAEQLKSMTLDYIAKHVGLLKTAEWKELGKTNFELANEVTLELLKLV